MIKKFIFENFKSFGKAELYTSDVMTLIGTNASGKSNAIEGIRILSMLSFGTEIGVILDGTRNVESMIRGGSQGCKRFRTNGFKLGCRVESKVGASDLLYEIKIRVNGAVEIEEEGLYIVRKEDTDNRKKKVFRAENHEKGGKYISAEYGRRVNGQTLLLSCNRNAAVLTQIADRIDKEDEEDKKYASYVNEVIDALKNIFVLMPMPSAMRNYSQVTDRELRMNGENISSALYDICKDLSEKNRILSFLHKLPENEIEDISFVKTRIGDVIFQLKEKYLSSYESVDAKKLSDGTLRCVAIIVAAISLERNGILVVEEIDNGVHPSRVSELVRDMTKILKEKESRLLITTHNVGLLNDFEGEELSGVSLIYRAMDSGTSEIIPVNQIKQFPSYVLGSGLGTAMKERKIPEAIFQGEKSQDYSWLFDEQ